MSWISTCLRLVVERTSFPSRKVCGSLSMARRSTDKRSAKSTKWPPVTFETNLLGTGTCPGPTTKALPRTGGDGRTAELEGKLEQSDEENGLGGRAELGVVMAETGVNVLINGGRDSLPEETTALDEAIAAEILASGAAEEGLLAVNVAELQVEVGAVQGCKADRMFGRVDPNARATASAIASAETMGEATGTVATVPGMDTTVEDGPEDDEVEEIVPAANLLLVERGSTMV